MPSREDLTGKKFNHWTIIEELGGGKVLCECDCAEHTRKELYKKHIKSGASKSCGCANSKDVIGMKFGHWTVLEDLGNGRVKCRCDCPSHTEAALYKSNLLSGSTTSCGCAKAEASMRTKMRNRGSIGASVLQPSSEQSKKISEALRGDFWETLWSRLKVYGAEERIVPPNIPSMFFKDRKLAIIYNDLHSNGGIDKRSQNFYKLCVNNGLRLIQIFEYEWASNRDKTLAYIMSLFEAKRTVFARECTVKEIDGNLAYMFELENHLQGDSKSKINFGTFLGDELVGVMTFGSNRFNEGEYEQELIRLCSLSGTVVTGGAQKMFKAFISKYSPSSILSYCDVSKFQGGVYEKLGFSYMGITDPGYVWVKADDPSCVLTRYRTQKSKLISMGYGSYGNTENEIMTNIGYIKVYNCGNAKYVWTNR